jgi:hypothetical protein
LYCLFKFVHCYWFSIVYAFQHYSSLKNNFYFLSISDFFRVSAVDKAFKSCKKVPSPASPTPRFYSQSW